MTIHTSRSNPILVDFRAIYNETTPTIYQGYWELAEIWLELLDIDPGMSESINWGALAGQVDAGEIRHARSVFERLVHQQEES